MTGEPIDFEAVKSRRVEATIDTNQVQWEVTHRRLLDVMVTSGLADVGLTSATLRALLDVLTADDNVKLDDV